MVYGILENNLTEKPLCDSLISRGDAMFQGFKNVQIIGASIGKSVKKERVKDRKCHVFFYKTEGESLYRFDQKEVIFSTDKVIFLPKGSNYYFESIGETDGQYIALSFYADHDGPLEPLLICPDSPGEVRKLFIKNRQAFRFGGDIGKLEAYSYFYKLLSIFERKLKESEGSTVQDQRIESAVCYLHEHLFDPSLRISELHLKCKLSAPTFRKLFEQQFSASPKKYVLQQRMLEARLILRNGEYENIAQVAEKVGFEDQLYFSKCFKAFYGVAPSKF